MGNGTNNAAKSEFTVLSREIDVMKVIDTHQIDPKQKYKRSSIFNNP